ncbi:MAG TPA: hypothetical protein VGD68_03365, partial [Streptosporangiaceae bacterium]
AVYLLMSVLGGLYFAVTGFMGKIAKYVPTYQVLRIGTDVISGHPVPFIAFVVIGAWFALFMVLAVVSVRATAETV